MHFQFQLASYVFRFRTFRYVYECSAIEEGRKSRFSSRFFVVKYVSRCTMYNVTNAGLRPPPLVVPLACVSSWLLTRTAPAYRRLSLSDRRRFIVVSRACGHYRCTPFLAERLSIESRVRLGMKLSISYYRNLLSSSPPSYFAATAL